MIEEERIKVIPFMAEDLMRLEGLEMAAEARLKHISGPAVSAFLDGELVLCAGIQTEGIGEVWLSVSEDAKKQKLTLLKKCRGELEGMMRVHKIWRLWSESPDTDARINFIKHLGFRKIEAYTKG